MWFAVEAVQLLCHRERSCVRAVSQLMFVFQTSFT